MNSLLSMCGRFDNVFLKSWTSSLIALSAGHAVVEYQNASGLATMTPDALATLRCNALALINGLTINKTILLNAGEIDALIKSGIVAERFTTYLARWTPTTQPIPSIGTPWDVVEGTETDMHLIDGTSLGYIPATPPRLYYVRHLSQTPDTVDFFPCRYSTRLKVLDADVTVNLTAEDHEAAAQVMGSALTGTSTSPPVAATTKLRVVKKRKLVNDATMPYVVSDAHRYMLLRGWDIDSVLLQQTGQQYEVESSEVFYCSADVIGKRQRTTPHSLPLTSLFDVILHNATTTVIPQIAVGKGTKKIVVDETVLASLTTTQGSQAKAVDFSLFWATYQNAVDGFGTVIVNKGSCAPTGWDWAFIPPMMKLGGGAIQDYSDCFVVCRQRDDNTSHTCDDLYETLFQFGTDSVTFARSSMISDTFPWIFAEKDDEASRRSRLTNQLMHQIKRCVKEAWLAHDDRSHFDVSAAHSAFEQCLATLKTTASTTFKSTLQPPQIIFMTPTGGYLDDWDITIDFGESSSHVWDARGAAADIKTIDGALDSSTWQGASPPPPCTAQ